MNTVMRTPLFWILFVCTALGASYFGYSYFPYAYPIVHLDLTMNRSEALSQASALAAQFNLGPQSACKAAHFNTDGLVKTFIELEAGGKEQLVTIMEEHLYEPYTWQVRLFHEYNPHEAIIFFTPQGKPYGFTEHIAEEDLRKNISKEEALEYATRYAQSDPWNVDLAPYTLVESSQEKQPNGRIDHIFLYERSTLKIGEGFYRLKLVVSGDHVSELVHFIKVPETFIQRYSNMRSANENIAYAAKLALLLLYAIGGCLIGLFMLHREHRTLWRMPFWWALFISGITTIQNANELPIQWMFYNTAFSTTGFLLQQILSMLIEFIYWFFILFISIIAAESLTRKAFKNNLQLWHLWNPSVASSLPVLGQTVAGYLCMPFLLCFTVFFYFYTTQFLGWWTPSDALFNPDILATYVPWWQSIAISLRAGFWEECLFRAVPLAAAALLGTYFGKRNWWITGAFILQAIIFGAAHANYPAQPSYARLVELLFISSFFGGIYLKFGLLPGIITHCIYDVFWFSIPIFISQAWFNKIMIVIVSLIPLWIILYARYKEGKWNIISPTLYNKAWNPTSVTPPQHIEEPQKTISFSHSFVYGLFASGIIGFVVWAITTQFTHDGLPFTLSRNQASHQAAQILTTKKINPSDWYSITAPFTGYSDANNSIQQRFIWQEGGKNVYHSLLGTYLTPPYWLTRYVHFDGPLEKRSEEHLVYLRPNGTVYRYTHIMPENMPGEKLSQETAHAIALAAIFKQYGKQTDELTPISAIAQKHPDRLDWIFTFACPDDYSLNEGQARIQVTISGNELSDISQYIHVPEQWSRSEENRQLVAQMIKSFCSLCVYLILLCGSLYIFTSWNSTIRLQHFVMYTGILLFILLFELFNSWPVAVINFNTSQPFWDQLFRTFGIAPLSLCLRAVILGLLFAFTAAWKNRYKVQLAPIFLYGMGISIGTLFAGIQSLIEKIIPSVTPLWPNYTPLKFLIPITAGVNSYILNYISLTLLLLLIVIALNGVTNKKYQTIKIIFMILMGIMTIGLIASDNLPLLFTLGISVGILFVFSYFLYVRYSLAIIPSAVATYFVFYAMQQGWFHAYAHAGIISIQSSVILLTLAWLWCRILHKNL